MTNKSFHYFLEGETEERMLKILKSVFLNIHPGKHTVFNVTQRRLSSKHLMKIKTDTVVLIFDTDTINDAILEKNIALLKRYKYKVVCIPQIENFEDELTRATGLKHARDLTGSLSDAAFKSDFISQCNIEDKLKKRNFDFEKFWTAGKDRALQLGALDHNIIRKDRG